MAICVGWIFFLFGVSFVAARDVKELQNRVIDQQQRTCRNMQRLALWAAHSSCFDAEFPRDKCCETEDRPFANPTCFDDNPFGVGTYEVCCLGQEERVHIPLPSLLVSGGCWNPHAKIPANCPLSEVFRQNCPDAIPSLFLVAKVLRARVMPKVLGLNNGTRVRLPRRRDFRSGWLQLLRSDWPVAGLLHQYWRQRQLESRKVSTKTSAANDMTNLAVLRSTFLYTAEVPHLRSLPKASASLASISFASGPDGALNAAVSMLHAAAWLVRSGEPVSRAVAAAERLANRWARVHGSLHRQSQHASLAALLLQPSAPLFGLLFLLWGIRRQYQEPDILAESSARSIRSLGSRLRKMSIARHSSMPNMHLPDDAWGDAFEELPEGTPPWAQPILSYETDPEARGDRHGQCTHLRGLLLHLPSDATVLDVGAGTAPCRAIWEMRDDIKYVTQDAKLYDTADYDGSGFKGGFFAEGSPQAGGYGRIDITSDITSIPLEDASVDMIICEQVLEHVPRPEVAAQEFARLLKPGGFLAVTMPYGPYLHNLPYHFNGGLTKGWFQHHLGEANFTGIWASYRYHLPGKGLSRMIVAEDCVHDRIGTKEARLWRQVLSDVVPLLTDTIPGLCPSVARRPQGIAVAAVK